MAEKWVQHIGDDQLVGGMPKHMSSVAGESSQSGGEEKGLYWTVHPKPKACDKCKAMAVWKYLKEPQRPHPNCKCEIRKHLKVISIMGLLKGYRSKKTHTFNADLTILVEVKNLGPFAAGAWIKVDDKIWKCTGLMSPGQSETFKFSKSGEIPLPWKIMVMYDAGDNSILQYFIRG